MSWQKNSLRNEWSGGVPDKDFIDIMKGAPSISHHMLRVMIVVGGGVEK